MKFRRLNQLAMLAPSMLAVAPGWSDLPTDDEVIDQIRSVPEHFANILRFPRVLEQLGQYGIFSDFVEDQADVEFVDTVTDSGTAAVGDAVKGIMVLTPSDGSVVDNDEVYLASPNEIFLIAAGKPIYGLVSLQFTETSAGVYNAAFGFINAVGANTLVDDGGGPKASFSGAVIYKVDGGTVWRCRSSIGTTYVDSISTSTAGGAAYQVLEIEFVDFTSTHMKAIYKINGLPLKDSDGRDIVHTVPVASATEMQVFAGAKLGASTNNDVLNLDYLGGWQLR